VQGESQDQLTALGDVAIIIEVNSDRIKLRSICRAVGLFSNLSRRSGGQRLQWWYTLR
jgi:hypothetical protein